MTTIAALLNHPTVHVMAWTLGHFLWQGAFIAAVAAMAMRGARTSLARYAIGTAGLASMFFAPTVTFAWLSRVGTSDAGTIALNAAPVRPLIDSATASAGAAASSISAAAIVIALWSIGVIALSIRLLGGWLVARRIAHRAVRPVSAEIQALVTRVAGRLALERVVRVVESSAVAVPMMVGWLAPVVLLPAAALSGFSPAQIEALVAHELAHVRRHDYFVNLLQSAVETLLFYHPAVWWLSRRVRAEREHCCDDIALTICDRIVYATALTDLAALVHAPRLALAATDGSLMARVRRILGRTDRSPDTGAGWLPLLVCVAVLGTLATAFWSARGFPKTPSLSAETPAITAQATPVAAASAPTLPADDTAGIPKTVVQTTQTRQEPPPVTPAEKELEQRIEEIKKTERALEELRRTEITANERDRLKIELARTEAEMKTKSLSTMREIEALKSALSAAARQVDVGMKDPREVEDLRRQMADAEGRLQDVQREREFEAAKILLGQKQLEQNEMYEKRRAEIDESRRKIDEIVEAAGQAKEKKLLMNRPVRPDGERIRIGDLLFVEISGEPDLPKTYDVQSTGSIRLPLLGAIRVEGSTADQVAKDLTSLLASRKLGENREVTVHTHRRE